MEGEKMFIQVHKIEMCQNRNVAIEEEKLIIEKKNLKIEPMEKLHMK